MLGGSSAQPTGARPASVSAAAEGPEKTPSGNGKKTRVPSLLRRVRAGFTFHAQGERWIHGSEGWSSTFLHGSTADFRVQDYVEPKLSLRPPLFQRPRFLWLP